MRAVFYRQFAREADSMAHKCSTPETRNSYRQLAIQWRSLAEQMDDMNDFPDIGEAGIHPLNVSTQMHR
jgi:hypothetical protein